MKLSTVLLGAGIAVGGYLAYQRFLAPKPASSTPTNPTAPTKSPIAGYANDIGASLLSKLSVAFGGSSTWRAPTDSTTPKAEQVATSSIGEIDLNQSSYSKLAPARDSLSFVV